MRMRRCQRGLRRLFEGFEERVSSFELERCANSKFKTLNSKHPLSINGVFNQFETVFDSMAAMERNILFKEIHTLNQKPPSVFALENELFEREIAPYPVDTSVSDGFSLGFKTLYLETDIGVKEKVPELTGVYLPTDFGKATQLDVIIYFHGLVRGTCADRPREFKKRGVAYYWQAPIGTKRQPNFQLREWLQGASRKAILIVPTLGTNSQKDFGQLANPRFFDAYLNGILKTLASESLIPKAAAWRHIVLAGHSGGGSLMQKIVGFDREKSQYLQNIQECWGLDCFYYGTTNWKKWLKTKQPEQRLLAFHTGHRSSADTAKDIKKYADKEEPPIAKV